MKFNILALRGMFDEHPEEFGVCLPKFLAFFAFLIFLKSVSMVFGIFSCYLNMLLITHKASNLFSFSSLDTLENKFFTLLCFEN